MIPDGVVGLYNRLRQRTLNAVRVHADRHEASAQPLRAAPAASTLELSNVSKHFGGLKAVDGLNLVVPPGQIRGIVGPNGAGKTTVLNLIAGLTVATAGTVTYGDLALGKKPLHEVARQGISRTFQNLALFADLTALENVMVGLHMHGSVGPVASLCGGPAIAKEDRSLRERASQLLSFVGLEADGHRLASALPQGHQRLLEIARALATGPSMLLLDEPAAGLNAAEIEHLTALILMIKESGTTIILIEHHMQLVMAVCDQVTVLEFGRIIADGTAQQVRRDPAVIAAYLGKPRGIKAPPEAVHA
jgi:branched-chain amino acid transport system ATP-binding protein